MRWPAVLLALCLSFAAQAETDVVIKTSLGDITVRLNREKAPITVANFLSYVDDGSYAGNIFHRVIEDFMIQSGGYLEDLSEARERERIRNEADNGLRNRKGTIAMARSGEIDSAGRQFFINTKNNYSLDHSARSCTREMEAKYAAQRAKGRYRPVICKTFGYAVFGEVISGMDVVETIEKSETGIVGDFHDMPINQIMILSVERLPSQAE